MKFSSTHSFCEIVSVIASVNIRKKLAHLQSPNTGIGSYHSLNVINYQFFNVSDIL